MLAYGILHLIYWLLDLAILLVIAAAFIAAIARPAQDFALASQTKTFWVLILLLGLLLAADGFIATVIHFVPGIIKGLGTWLCLFAAVYYLGPERRRMGPTSGTLRWPFGEGNAGNSRKERGSW